MSMQDKEMDALFRAKLDNYEIEPSANVWTNISREMHQPAQRKSYVPLLRIAASVLVLVSAGLFFLPKKEVVTNPPKNNRLAQNTMVKPVTGTQQPSVNQQVTEPATHVATAVNVQPKQQIAAVVKHTHVPQTTTEPAVTKSEPKAGEQVIVPNTNQQTIATVTTKPAVSTPVVPDGPITLKPADDTQGFVSKPILASDNTDTDSGAKPVQKHKAHGLGSFLNKVIAAVDKRDDKIIEFTDTDEGDSITGINLGILKVKKVK
ncbi:hypothetical protein [Mucilaginibacter boryungensis]|uniref:Uncharacterized protein n=1 Tax=Mucilaginibacter boryungensis TaxID=768480 RepID=A0ABR9XIJ0_9SPHI|nr:hypothetical protein [Mucilaginibacter boryungensis]MBE9667046.1 hypothetical protein [Mucilaginibacter boryungensis]